MCSLTGLLVLVLLGAVSAKTCAQNSDCDVTFERCCSGVCTNQVADPQGGTSCSPACTCDQICCNGECKDRDQNWYSPNPYNPFDNLVLPSFQRRCGQSCPDGFKCCRPLQDRQSGTSARIYKMTIITGCYDPFVC